MCNSIFHVSIEPIHSPQLSLMASLFCRQCSSVPDHYWCGVLSILSPESLPFSPVSCFKTFPFLYNTLQNEANSHIGPLFFFFFFFTLHVGCFFYCGPVDREKGMYLLLEHNLGYLFRIFFIFLSFLTW